MSSESARRLHEEAAAIADFVRDADPPLTPEQALGYSNEALRLTQEAEKEEARMSDDAQNHVG